MEKAKKEQDRQRRLTEIATINASRLLIEEINKSEDMSREEKMREIQELLQQSQAMATLRERGRRGNKVEFEAANTIRKMLQDIAKDKNLSDQERKKEFQRVLEEAKKMKLDTMRPMIGIEKFKFELNQLLKSEGLYPEGKAEFRLNLNECSIDGKKLPDEIHQKILQLGEKNLGKTFDRDTKIILQLNEGR
jgi:intein/homing endonuclease